MDEKQAAGTAKNLAGEVEEGVGHAVGDVKTEVEGKGANRCCQEY
jgi:uncharacterized protein YjbJ (UPF0337 family)